MKILIVTLSLIGLNAHAQYNTFRPPVESAGSNVLKINPTDEKLKSDDLDKEVTDNKLRASSGSKSKYSASLFFGYAGASLNQPGGERRPNVGEKNIPERVNATGNVGLRFRVNKNDSIFAGIGFYQPIGGVDKGREAQMNTPHLAWNRTKAAGEFEMGQDVRVYITTLDDHRAIGEVGSIGYGITGLHAINESRFKASAGLNFTFTQFDNDGYEMMGRPGHQIEMRAIQNDYRLTFIPSLQFNQSDRLNYYSKFNIMNFTHWRTNYPTQLQCDPPTMQVGAGYAILRDLYIQPYMAFETKKISADRTSVNLQAIINL